MKKVTLILYGVINIIGLGLISPVMTDFAADFPQISETLVAQVVTMPAATLLIGLFASSLLSNRVRHKLILLSGLVLTIAGGMLPAFLSNFYLILLSRGILGFGMGLGMPIQMAYFAQYPEKERAVLLGLNTAIGGLLSAGLFTTIAMVQMSWRRAFMLYGIFIIVLLCCYCFIPLEQKQSIRSDALEKQKKAGLSLPSQLIFGYIVVFFVYVQYYIMPATISFYVKSHQLGGVTEAGLTSSIGTLSIAAASLSFPVVRKFLAQWLTAVVLFIGAAGFVLYAFPYNYPMLLVSYCIVSIMAAVYPIIVTMRITETLPFEQVAFGAAVFTGMIYLGQFVSPYYQAMIATFTGSVERAYIAFGVIIAVFAVSSIFLTISSNKT